MQTTFIPGEEWLYYKIYCGAKTSDILLEKTIKASMDKLVREQKIDKWFFIRYQDPDYHIRLRLHFIDTKHIGIVMEDVKNDIANYINNDSMYKIQLDTYQREIERYGVDTMKQAESLFYNDSTNICQALEYIFDEELWLLFTLKSIDDLLENFGFDVNKKLAFATHQMGLYKEEFKVSKSINKNLSKKYRQRKSRIDDFLTSIVELHEYKSLSDLLMSKSQKDKPIIQEISKAENNNLIFKDKLLGSLIHMSVNRTFRSKQRAYEMLLYDFLVRYYRGIIGRRNM